MKHLLPPTSIYIQYLSTASARFNLSMNECRDKFGLYTEKQWLDLLSAGTTTTKRLDNKSIKLNQKT